MSEFKKPTVADQRRPHKYTVCPECRGEGFVSRIKGGFTREDAEDWYGPDVDEFLDEYTTRGGAYDEHCPACLGQRVLSPEAKVAWEEHLEYEAERNAEIRAGC